MYFHEFQTIFVNFRFTNIFVKISTDISDISVISDILFLGSNILVLKQHYEYKLLELEEEKKVCR